QAQAQAQAQKTTSFYDEARSLRGIPKRGDHPANAGGCSQALQRALRHLGGPWLWHARYSLLRWRRAPSCLRPPAGSRVKMSAARLRAQCLPAGTRCSYTSVMVDGILAGNVFACRWDCAGRQDCWITQLVVHRAYRERRLATGLLQKLARNNDDDIFGIMSSHPAACMAASKALAEYRYPSIPLDFTRDHAAAVIAGSPIAYVKDAKLRGSLFASDGADGLVSGADSSFFVDHSEPLEALKWLRARERWHLGDLPDGHEFLVVLEASPRRRS
ncbi:Uncharacterized protein TCAP_02545, partial [Tolypocladium capitatum]